MRMMALFAVLVSIFSSISGYLVERSGRPTVVLEMRSRGGADGEMFFAAGGEPFAPERRISFEIIRDGKWHLYEVDMPTWRRIDRLRIDPGSSSGMVQIRSVELKSRHGSSHLTADTLSAAVASLNQMSPSNGRESEKGFRLSFEMSSPDPFIEIEVGPRSATTSVASRIPLYLLAGAMMAALCLVASRWLAPKLKLLQRRLAGTHGMGGMVRALSDEGALIVTPSMVAALLVVLSMAGVYVAFALHQSSIGVWEEMFPSRSVPQFVDIGAPRHVRSDEWNTQTPWVLNQVFDGMPIENESIGGEKAPLLASVPVSHASALAQFKFFGFRLFDVDHGYSWWWAYKAFGLLLAAFWMLLLLTRGNIGASALGAAWIYGSSATQWWLSSNLPELLIAFFLAVTGAFYLLFARRLSAIAVGAALCAYAVLNLLLHLYPPFIIPLAYLGVAILAGLLLEQGAIKKLKYGLRWRLVCATAAVAIVAGIGSLYLAEAFRTIDTMMATVYPGRRTAVSGDFPLARFLSGYFEAFRVGESQVPLPPTNASEAAGFVLLFPLLLLVVSPRVLFSRQNSLLTAIFAYCIFVTCWVLLPLPGPLQSFVQATGWSWSPPARSMLGLGVASIILMVIIFSRIQGNTIQVQSVDARRMAIVVVVAFLLPLGYSLKQMDPSFFTNMVLGLGIVSVALITAGVSMARAWLLAAGLALLVVPALMVNPLMSGLSSVTEKPILVAAREATNERDKWAVFGAFVFSQGLKVQGLDVVTGSKFVPDKHLSGVLDPARKNESVWNRYAHVVFTSRPGHEPVFELKGPDLYVVQLDVCGKEMDQLGITLVAYTEAVPHEDLVCLRPVSAPIDSGVRLFRRLGVEDRE